MVVARQLAVGGGAIGLAIEGLDRTRVVILANRTITTHIVELEAIGAFGHFTFREDVAVSAENRKTGTGASCGVLPWGVAH